MKRSYSRVAGREASVHRESWDNGGVPPWVIWKPAVLFQKAVIVCRGESICEACKIELETTAVTRENQDRFFWTNFTALFFTKIFTQVRF